MVAATRVIDHRRRECHSAAPSHGWLVMSNTVPSGALNLRSNPESTLVAEVERGGAELHQPFGDRVLVLDEDTEVVGADEVEAAPDLVGLEPQHGEVQRAVGQQDTFGERVVRVEHADSPKAEGRFVERRRCLGVRPWRGRCGGAGS